MPQAGALPQPGALRPATPGLPIRINLGVSSGLHQQVAQSATYGCWGGGFCVLAACQVWHCKILATVMTAGTLPETCVICDPIRMHFVSSCASGPAQCHQAVRVLVQVAGSGGSGHPGQSNVVARAHRLRCRQAMCAVWELAWRQSACVRVYSVARPWSKLCQDFRIFMW